MRGRKFINLWFGISINQVVEFSPKTLTVKLKVPSAQGDGLKTYQVHAKQVKPYISHNTGKLIRGPTLEDEVGLPGGDGEECLKHLSTELKEPQLELEYDGAYANEGLEFLDRVPYTNEDDMVRWPASRGNPIPRVEVEDPGMPPDDVPRHGTQGTLGNPRGTPAQAVPDKTPKDLTPDRVVVQLPAPKPQTDIPPPTTSRPLDTNESPKKRVRMGGVFERPIPPRADGPAHNTRQPTRQNKNGVISLRLKCGVSLAAMESIQRIWMKKLSSTGGVKANKGTKNDR